MVTSVIYNLVLIVTIICFFLFYYYSYHYHTKPSIPLSRNSPPPGKHHHIIHSKDHEQNDNISSQNIQLVGTKGADFNPPQHVANNVEHSNHANEHSNYVKFHPYKSDTSDAETDPAALEQQRKNNIVSAVGFFLVVFFLMVHFFTQQTRHLANDYVYGLNMSLYLFHIQFNPNTLKLIKISPTHAAHSAATSKTATSTQDTTDQLHQETTTTITGSVTMTTTSTAATDHIPQDGEDTTEERPSSSMKTLSFYSQGGADQNDDLNDIDVKRLNAFIDENRRLSVGVFPSGKMILPPHLQVRMRFRVLRLKLISNSSPSVIIHHSDLRTWNEKLKYKRV